MQVRSTSTPALLRGLPRHVWWVAAAFGVVYGVAAILRVHTFQASYFDLGFMLDGLEHLAAGRPNAVIEPAGWSLFEDHFSPVLFVFAPLAVLPGAAYVLVLAQALLVALAIALVGGLLQASSLSPQSRQLAFAAFVVVPGLGYAVLFDFHPTVAALPLAVVMVRGLVESVDAWLVVGGAGLALVREDMAVLVVLMTIAYGARRRAVLIPGGVAAAALVLWRMTAGGPQYFSEASYSYVSFSDPLGTVGGAMEALWAEGLVVFLVVVLALPWAMLRGWSARPLVVGAIFYTPLLLSALFNTKSVGFHYYVLAGLFATWSLVEGRPVDLSDRRTAAAVALLVVTAVIGPLGTGSAAPPVETVLEAARPLLTDGAAVAASHAALDCLDPAQPTSMTSSLTMLTDIDVVRAYPSPFAPILAARGVDVEAEVAPVPGPPIEVVVLDDDEVNSTSDVPFPVSARVGSLTIYTDSLAPAVSACLGSIDAAGVPRGALAGAEVAGGGQR